MKTNSVNIDRLIQIVTAIVVLIGLGLVVWELQQAKSLAFTQVIHGNVDNLTEGHTSVFGEDLSRVLATACFEPAELDRAGAFVLDAYFQFRLNYVNRLKVQVEQADFDTDWRLVSRQHVQAILSFPQGRRWLNNSNSWLLRRNPELAEFVTSTLAMEVRPCHVSVGTILSLD